MDAEDLEPLLQEETRAWRTALDWDFRVSADLVRRFMRLRALDGVALLADREIAGYSYFVAEEGKGLIGDFYLRSGFPPLEGEKTMLTATLDSLWTTPGVRRVEAQLLMLRSEAPAAVYPRWARTFPRLFVEADLSSPAPLPPRGLARVAVAPWAEEFKDSAARLIVEAYEGHIDSRINEQYGTESGARRFLSNIIQYPGCGAFFSPASFVATDRITGAIAGVSLASLVSSRTGHITQVCVAPGYQKQGVGYELLRNSLLGLRAQGCNSVGLTVTQANQSALRMYESMGFRTRLKFSANVWELP